MKSCFFLRGYGSITTVHVYVPGFWWVAVAWAGSLGPCAEFPMSFGGVLESTQVILELVAPATCDAAFTVRLVSGVSLAEKVASLPSPHVELALTVTVWAVLSSIAYPFGAEVSCTE